MSSNAQQFLDAAYTELDFSSGDLVCSDTSPTDESWIEKGDWITLTKQVGADRIFFVDRNPVIVFVKQDSDDPEILRQLYKKIWCMSRPNLLFLATPGVLSVYDLTQPPSKTTKDWINHKPLDVVKNVTDVASALKAYHRAQIESGRLFEEKRFGSLDRRADHSLINDLRVVRAELMQKGLKKEFLKYAHALIGRSIFIRYLEDRNVLTKEYFLTVARKTKGWTSILNSELQTPYAEPEMSELNYLKVLSHKDFTYALFDQLAEDFNGDMFPEDQRERQIIKQEHLILLQGFLRGDTGPQRKLFFWAYKFDIIPIELISSIYEEFYSAQNDSNKSTGTHYTPSALVDFLLSQTLTPEQLDKNPKILDPSCGSGIFLVESFRRIVRYRVYKQGGKRLETRQLRKILREQIYGIDINEEAIKVTAFSLYLALLHCQEPPDVLAQMKKGYCLPCLIKGNKLKTKSEHFDTLLKNNAFSDNDNIKFNIVVGNPPWGDAPTKDIEARKQAKVALDWCKDRKYPVGDRERSQTFIWRAINSLDKGGIAALLVSTGIFYKHHSKSIEFRRKFLQNIVLHQVVNFGHVRKVFFTGSIAPFASIIFENSIPLKNHRFLYTSAKKSAMISSLQSVILTHSDFSFLNQNQIIYNDALWKVFWWGTHHDVGLIEALRTNSSLGTKIPNTKPQKYIDFTGQRQLRSGQGYTPGNVRTYDWLIGYDVFPAEEFYRYGSLPSDSFKKIPPKAHRPGKREVFDGKRILVKRGIEESVKPKGQIISRYEDSKFCFTNSINGIITPNHK